MTALVAVVIALGFTAAPPGEASGTDHAPADGAPTATGVQQPLAGPAAEPPRSAGEAPVIMVSPGVVAGAAAAGFVGGGMFAVPAVLAVLPLGGPFVAVPVGLAIAMGGAAFGGFVGELSYARLGGSGIVALVAGAGGLVGAAAGGVGAFALASSSSSFSQSDAALFGFAGAAVVGVAGAAAGGAAGAFWVTPEER